MHYRMCVTRNRGVSGLYGLGCWFANEIALAFQSGELKPIHPASTHPEPISVGHTGPERAERADQLRHLSHSIRMASGICASSVCCAKRRKRLSPTLCRAYNIKTISSQRSVHEEDEGDWFVERRLKRDPPQLSISYETNKNLLQTSPDFYRSLFEFKYDDETRMYF